MNLSLDFAHRQVASTRHRAERALEHLELMQWLAIEPAIRLAEHHCTVSNARFQTALGKRAFELRQNRFAAS